ncbi:MAG: 3-oxoacyl-ACP synthase [Cytophagaceae bacterium SCN 52-12]|nr:MAG: 3-oxoacyl-ACP synthase [Cytophagaceae bacterium SCN 52-12]
MTEVVVTGIGIVSPLGVGAGHNLQNLREKKHGLSRADFFETRYVEAFPFGEVKFSDPELKAMLGAGSFRGFTRTCMLAFLAFREAIEDASLEADDLSRFDTGFISASTVGGMCYTDQLYVDANASGEASEFVQSYAASAHTRHIARHFGIHGFSDTINTACSSSANAIALGYRLIRAGRMKRVIVGGVDSLAKYTVNGFNSLRILSEDLCLPFDENRKGLNLGEGAGYLVLEDGSVSGNKRRYGKVLGYGNSNDAYHASTISPEAAGVVKAIGGALRSGNVDPGKISYVNTHGTGTLNNDEMELLGMLRIFGKLPYFSSTKGYTGHTLGAAGAIEAIFSLFSLSHNEIYPNLRFETPIAQFGEIPVLDLLTDRRVEYVLSNSFGFSGNCTSLLFGR